jgi:CRISPR-associated protein Cst2
MNRNVNGVMLIDAPHSILNNFGKDAGELLDNSIVVKTIQKQGKVYPYMSPQSYRYAWRNTLKEKYAWNLSPIERDNKIAFTKANPFEYPDDDIFGYMRAQGKKDGGTVTRISPLKCSPLVSISPQKPTSDYAVMARQEGNPVPYEYQFYSTIMKGIFSLDLDSVGCFSLVDKTGYRNLTDNMLKKAMEYGCIVSEDKRECRLPNDVRAKRAAETIKALSYIYGGAKQTTHLTDITPKFIILCIIEGGNHIFMNIVKEQNDKGILDFEALNEVINEYKDIIKSDIYIGKRKGFMDEVENEIKGLKNVVFGPVNEIINKFAEEVKAFYMG